MSSLAKLSNLTLDTSAHLGHPRASMNGATSRVSNLSNLSIKNILEDNGYCCAHWDGRGNFFKTAWTPGHPGQGVIKHRAAHVKVVSEGVMINRYSHVRARDNLIPSNNGGVFKHSPSHVGGEDSVRALARARVECNGQNIRQAKTPILARSVEIRLHLAVQAPKEFDVSQRYPVLVQNSRTVLYTVLRRIRPNLGLNHRSGFARLGSYDPKTRDAKRPACRWGVPPKSNWPVSNCGYRVHTGVAPVNFQNDSKFLKMSHVGDLGSNSWQLANQLPYNQLKSLVNTLYRLFKSAICVPLGRKQKTMGTLRDKKYERMEDPRPQRARSGGMEIKITGASIEALKNELARACKGFGLSVRKLNITHGPAEKSSAIIPEDVAIIAEDLEERITLALNRGVSMEIRDELIELRGRCAQLCFAASKEQVDPALELEAEQSVSLAYGSGR